MSMTEEEKRRIYNEEKAKIIKSGETSISWLEGLGDMVWPFGSSEEYKVRREAREDGWKENSEKK